jgi:hypothetical protein
MAKFDHEFQLRLNKEDVYELLARQLNEYYFSDSRNDGYIVTHITWAGDGEPVVIDLEVPPEDETKDE